MRDWVTSTKTRYLAGWSHTTEQQVLRVDREPSWQLSESVQEAIERKARQVARKADAVILSDYGFGAATPALARKLKAKRVTLDSRYRLLEYADAGITRLRLMSRNSRRPTTSRSERISRSWKISGTVWCATWDFRRSR